MVLSFTYWSGRVAFEPLLAVPCGLVSGLAVNINTLHPKSLKLFKRFITFEFGLSKVIIGATILAFGTSLPELAASLSASIKAAGGQLKAADLAIGNVVGSNLANIALVLGFSLLYGSIKVGKEWNKLEFPSLIFFSVGFFERFWVHIMS